MQVEDVFRYLVVLNQVVFMTNRRAWRLKDGVKLEAFAWLLGLVLAYWLTGDFDRPLSHFPPGPAFWPQVVIICMILAACVLLCSRFLNQSQTSDPQIDYLDSVPDDLPTVGWRTTAMFIVPLIWVYGMHKAGFLLATPIFLIVFTWLMGVKRWRVLITYSLGFYSVLVLVFYKLIFTSLPMGAGYLHTINGELLALIQ